MTVRISSMTDVKDNYELLITNYELLNRPCGRGNVNRFSQERIRSAGFTLLEILVVVVVVVLMATAAGYFYSGTFKKMQLEKASKQLMLAAKYARLAAVERQINYKLIISEKENRFMVSYTDSDAEGEEKEMVVSNPYTKPVELDEPVSIEGITISRTVQTDEDEEDLEGVVFFTPYGTADSAVVKIGNGKSSCAVSISAATGKAKIIEDPEEVQPDVVDLDAPAE